MDTATLHKLMLNVIEEQKYLSIAQVFSLNIKWTHVEWEMRGSDGKVHSTLPKYKVLSHKKEVCRWFDGKLVDVFQWRSAGSVGVYLY